MALGNRDGWVARSRQRSWPAPNQNALAVGNVTTPVLPEKSQAEALNAMELERCLEANSRAIVELAQLQ
ncbi:unnamed protein product, partial [Choristocarpus tenellus]